MRRQLQGLSRAATPNEVNAGLYLVRVQHAHYRWHKQKPFYELKFYVLEPKKFGGTAILAQLSCAPKFLWKFAWFLRDFRYSQDLLEQDEIDTRAMQGLQGVVQVAYEINNGRSEVALKAFAPASDWPYLYEVPKVDPEVA